MRLFWNENRAKVFVLGTLAACGIVVMLLIAGITIRAVFLSPRPPGTLEPWVATGVADMATYSAAQTAAPQTPLPAVSPIPQVPGELPPAGSAAPTGQIVYTCFVDSNDDLCIMHADGSNVRRLTTEPATDWYGSLSPDGGIVVFSTRRDSTWELYLLDLLTLNVQRMTQDFGQVYAPEISPDGTRLVFATTLHGEHDVYVMNVDGTNAIRVTDHPQDDFDPTWSPDGARIAFTSNRTGTSELYIVEAPGGPLAGSPTPRQVTSGSNQQEGGRVDWSPDGQWLGFYAGEPGDKDVFMVPTSCADTGPCGPDQIVRLTDGGNNKAPSFSPDGQWVAFASQLDGDNEIWIMRLDGSGLTQLTFNSYADWQPRWGP